MSKKIPTKLVNHFGEHKNIVVLHPSNPLGTMRLLDSISATSYLQDGWVEANSWLDNELETLNGVRATIKMAETYGNLHVNPFPEYNRDEE